MSVSETSESTWYVYIVRCADDSLYTGVAVDIEARIAAHNSGKGARYTRSRTPVTLVYSESATDRSVAQQREYAIKQLSRAEKLGMIESEPAG